MTSKKINVLYWVFTLLFAALMLFASFPSIIVTDDSVKLIHDMLGYPIYFIPFTGVAKLLGVIVILIPGIRTIKEWAYAGLFFDLAGAVYSGIAVAKGTLDPKMLGMLVWIVPGILSYVYYRKKISATAKANPSKSN
jgi:DoxX-like family